MPRDQETIELKHSDGWVMVTNNDVVAFSFQVLAGEVQLRIGGIEQPDNNARGQINRLYEGALQAPLDRIAFGNGTRVWMKANDRGGAMVWIDHP